MPESHAERSRLPGQFLHGADVSQGADQRVADQVGATACSFEFGDGLFGEEPALFLADRAEPADLGAHALGQKGIATQRQRCVARIENDDVEADLCRRGRGEPALVGRKATRDDEHVAPARKRFAEPEFETADLVAAKRERHAIVAFDEELRMARISPDA